MKKFIIAIVVLMTLTVSGCGGTSGGTNKSSSGPVSAKQLFPHGITVIGTGKAGGSVDIALRLLQPYLQKALGVPVVVQNMAGGGGIEAFQTEYGQKPDSSTFMLAYLPLMNLCQVVGGGKFDQLKFTPLYGIYGGNTAVIIARKGSPWNSFEALKNSNKTLTVSEFGIGTTAVWMAVAFLSGINHVKLTPVPFGGGAPASQALIGGSVDLCSTTIVEAKQLIGEGKAQGVVQFAPDTLAALPGVESIAKVGQANEAFWDVLGFIGPPNMPAAQKEVMENALAEVVKSPELISRAKADGIEVMPQNPTQWADNIKKDLQMVEANKTLLESQTGAPKK